MPGKSILKRGFKKEAEELAIYFREELGISKFDLLKALDLANYLAVPVFTVKEVFSGRESSEYFIHLSDTKNFSAMWMPNADGGKIIIHNDNHSEFRQQSNLMHELSHIICKHTIPEEIKKLNIPFNLHYFNPLHEEEAKYLGGCLQITRPGLQWVIKRFSVEQISEYYRASVDMVRYRLNTTGVMKQFYYSQNR